MDTIWLLVHLEGSSLDRSAQQRELTAKALDAAENSLEKTEAPQKPRLITVSVAALFELEFIVVLGHGDIHRAPLTEGVVRHDTHEHRRYRGVTTAGAEAIED